jgi:hypothetical protein
MGKLRLDIKSSTEVSGAYAIVNIIFNDTNLAASKQLSTTVESLEYNADILTPGNNVLKIALLNSQANDIDLDGNFDLTLSAIVSNLSYSTDNVTFTNLIPQIETIYTVPTGPYTGNQIPLTYPITTWRSFDSNYAITFNNDGIVNTEYCTGLQGKVLPNGNYLDLVAGKTFDYDGNEV